MINTYYLLQDNEQTGPYTHHELMDMQLEPDTIVLSPIATHWQQVIDLPEFQEHFESRSIFLPTQQNKAGFWWRTLAFFIDYVLCMIGFFIIALLVDLAGNTVGNRPFTGGLGQFYMMVLLLSMYIIYHPLFESIKTQGSIGKIVCKLVVVNGRGRRISFWNALGRNVGKLLSSSICYLGFLNVLWDNMGQSWHDHMAKTYVVRKKQL